MNKIGVGQDQCQPFLRLKSGSEETVYYSVVYEGLPEEFRIVAETELNETEENRKKGMQRMKELVKKENMGNVSDIFLLAALRSCKYNVKKSEAKLRNFVAKRRAFVEQLVQLDTSKIEMIIEDMVVGLFPYRDKHGRGIIFSRPYAGNLEEYDFEDIFLVALSICHFLSSFPITSVAGIVYFGDCEAPYLSIFYPIFKSFRRHISTFLSYPYRIAEINIFNEMSLVRTLLNIFRILLPDKVNQRLFLRGAGYDSLHKHYDPRILPDVFGGSLGPPSSKLYKQRLLNFIKELKDEYPPNTSARQ